LLPLSSLNGQVFIRPTIAGSRRGNASELNGHSRVLWSETQNARDEAYPDRVLNGYVEVRLVGESIFEEFIGEDGSVRWSSS